MGTTSSGITNLDLKTLKFGIRINQISIEIAANHLPEYSENDQTH